MTKLASRLTMRPHHIVQKTAGSPPVAAANRWLMAARTPAPCLRAVQRLGQIVDQVLPVLDAHREADEPVVGSEQPAGLRRPPGARSDRGAPCGRAAS